MGLHHVDLFLFVLLIQLFFHCFAFDLVQHSHDSRQGGKKSFKRAEKPDIFNSTNPPKQFFYWKRRENDRITNRESYFWRDLNTVTQKSTTVTQSIRHSQSLISRYISRSVTPSYIEFDYSDDLQHKATNTNLKRFDKFGIGNGITKSKDYETTRSAVQGPLFDSYQVFDNPYVKQELVNTHAKSQLQNRRKLNFDDPVHIPDGKTGNKNKLKNKGGVRELISNIPFIPWKLVTLKVYSKATQTPTPTTSKRKTTSKQPIQCTARTNTVLPTLDDRVKFFEIYDNNTRKPPSRIRNFNYSSSEFEKQLDDMMSENINKDTNEILRCNGLNATNAGNKRKSFKKRSFKSETKSAISNKIQENKGLKPLHNARSDERSLPTNNTIKSQEKFLETDILAKTSVAHWSNYPFASVYVYKPTQTHCDAAGISPHWLLAAGACLSRQTLTHSIHERSAFVTYCGDHWRQPQRIAYVRRSIVHPKFNPKDEDRKLLYNIGLIQVSSSMAASCPLWAPVALMSHQFTDHSTGAMASAVGWGLDRYGTKYMSEQLPHWPLTVYEALVYHETCPGNIEYSMAKLQEGNGASNVYCLTLLPYTKEETDPVHGGLLLVGGKLVALYLQEQRRMHGAQSAQYTGVWRLLPWVMDVAREPDDAEATLDV